MPNKYRLGQTVYHFSQFASGLGVIDELGRDGDIYRVNLKDGGFTDAWEDEIGTHILFHDKNSDPLVKSVDDPLINEHLKNPDYNVLATDTEETCNLMQVRLAELNKKEDTESQQDGGE